MYIWSTWEKSSFIYIYIYIYIERERERERERESINKHNKKYYSTECVFRMV